jgi:hypothetical protein
MPRLFFVSDRGKRRPGTNSDSDSLKMAPNGDLVLTSAADGPGSGSAGVITLVSNPGTPMQSVQNVFVTDGMGNNVEGMDLKHSVLERGISNLISALLDLT